ncbi:tRNA uridine-5-carboxymethylaminomethyl(34) synthesis GTPase MnmE [Sinorhizobium sp. BG8]|uniref:tRNA uridine-5-carboxymethylaminomethyl(34) synthesis GTPase MnmE n=1 Tax=Sinorhizobium sp. BG8 TaxID=2613773 RepID=UPI00193CF54F|nr:tRNA uridine-5-carboxymethylaminomethyl(34) synthesis GTPase MnmE [Sinorhizobium sp. BG8]QRM56771.1 tRNA uridine-5-carboxymethylaminomethyl(34) synthesis GTPase MnmE [Sinorhizobium sp. BG8]
MTSSDTIFALSSGGLPSGVAVIRISGPQCFAVLGELCGPVPAPRVAGLRPIRNRNGEQLDTGLALYFPAPASFTGEDCGELQIHGGRAVVASVLRTLSESGLRQAEAGEFTRRAFHNGKLDLIEVEGLSDLIVAETEMQRRLASEHAAGGLSALYESWAKRLTHARAMIEAELDFADEDDVPGSVADTIWKDMDTLRQEIAKHAEGTGIGEIIRDGLKIVIAGKPNAGKSSLLNYLTKRDVAIVTDIPGTTRDVITVDLDLNGFAVRFYDTAGIRDTDEPVEREGIRRARLAMNDANLVLLLGDEPETDWDVLRSGHTGPVIRVGTKADLRHTEWLDDLPDVMISTRTGEGIDELLSRIRGHLPHLSGAGALALPSRQRHRLCLEEVADAIGHALGSHALGLDIQAEYLRLSAVALGRITGATDVENLLDVIFSEFCIGK